ncbi:hypothetical protein DFQ01_11025 [Paenibacillus cellulosilyticus]|uniref:Uncharacterized protein n=1 Tax=Paenibacillus cellulosilyticus TaxID=375489 RepID=A0A2V2Z1A2_9BACL|nr:hypothetical protein DFQ01_11025 [Paenibacillus cellulosilyticus]
MGLPSPGPRKGAAVEERRLEVAACWESCDPVGHNSRSSTGVKQKEALLSNASFCLYR